MDVRDTSRPFFIKGYWLSTTVYMMASVKAQINRCFIQKTFNFCLGLYMAINMRMKQPNIAIQYTTVCTSLDILTISLPLIFCQLWIHFLHTRLQICVHRRQ